MVSLVLPQAALHQWFRPQQVERLVRPINILLILWLAWLLAGLVWMLVPEPESGNAAGMVPATAMPVKAKEAPAQEQRIVQTHLFGEVTKEPAVRKAKPVEVPETRLNLSLRGVFASDEPGQARAIIGDPGGKEDSYAVGDPLPGGARLAEIYPDRIILERNGRFETLRLPKDRDLTRPRSVSHRSARRLENTGNGSRAAAFSRYRDEIRKNPSAFMDYVRATPARQGGKFIGFRLAAGRQRGALRELGLQPGDIVTAINGVTIDSPAKGMKAMQALGEGDTVSVTLLRGGQETSMSLSLPSARH
ncbi:MAG TPA: type II secretion system protein GspC [Gammaproteobacteria bacterium]|nr:type II secretion system protein GspC [Gammaproteobacteria bacterium]